MSFCVARTPLAGPNKALQQTAATGLGLPESEAPAVAAAAELGRSASGIV
jgi:hypothetical protein